MLDMSAANIKQGTKNTMLLADNFEVSKNNFLNTCINLD